MSANITRARPYARAAFDAARQANALGSWSNKLGFAAAVVAHPGMASVVGNPKVGAEQMLGLILPEGEARDGAFARMVALLIANRRLALLPEIAALFDGFKREHEKVLKVRVRAAVAVDAAQAESLKTALKRRFAREIELETVVDANVLGGAIIDAGDVVIDGSVRGRLERLRTALIQ
jgi:F-type H+-transporting ATPase subunit delta